MSLTVEDLTALQADHPDWRMELIKGEIVVMSPSGYESDEVAAEVIRVLGNWVRPRKLGRIAASSAGFRLPNSDLRAPDASFVLAERLRRSPKSFAQLAPDLTVEVKSPTDSLEAIRTKIQEFLSLGTRVGILINPDDRTVEVHRSEQAIVTLRDGDVLTVPDLLPGWEVQVVDLWAPEFD
ncbi:Uma2 family endonuclease [Phormidesmis priestleyi ULC007]|uniref:Uma2 family endonuclease n=1 Tax=Phormidesmis priestleyi ULC007 TaxID=1920490 RepID=A0A2T1DKJ9_9CYAN|nr:Uma2 family endonuclease [Phormidesmis priestleyi]PSB20954.1 Uma2 family endonuclease [Phormidesmis priestleyi ULC007]PZO51909.1 MAG: Uma2 family endonuclease [Phormidesmis priestleyi]